MISVYSLGNIEHVSVKFDIFQIINHIFMLFPVLEKKTGLAIKNS